MMLAAIPWLLSATTVVSMFFVGERHRWAWALALANQTLWLLWIVAAQQWGFLPGNIALWAVYVRNHMKWRAA